VRTFIFGAGASRHAGYPLAKSMGNQLFAWMKQKGVVGCFDFNGAAESLQALFQSHDDIEYLLTKVDEILFENDQAPQQLRALRDQLANREKPALVEAIRSWFVEIREQPAESYELFANKVIQPEDCVISFNYDVSLDRHLKRSGLWEIGDGYGFLFNSLPTGSAIKILKLHGSANWLDGVFFERSRPLIADSELKFLGYEKEVDPLFPRTGVAAIPTMILPAACKRFYADTSLGRKREGFWDEIWEQAENQIARSQQLILCGYGISPVDKRARRLLLEDSYSAPVEVCCGDDTTGIVRELRAAAHDAFPAQKTLFQDWVESAAK
jgi:hypothetical protein